jgi:Mg-chelatase subunit ChlI
MVFHHNNRLTGKGGNMSVVIKRLAKEIAEKAGQKEVSVSELQAELGKAQLIRELAKEEEDQSRLIGD